MLFHHIHWLEINECFTTYTLVFPYQKTLFNYQKYSKFRIIQFATKSEAYSVQILKSFQNHSFKNCFHLSTQLDKKKITEIIFTNLRVYKYNSYQNSQQFTSQQNLSALVSYQTRTEYTSPVAFAVILLIEVGKLDPSQEVQVSHVSLVMAVWTPCPIQKSEQYMLEEILAPNIINVLLK